MKKVFTVLALLTLIPLYLYSQGSGFPNNLRVLVDATGALVVSAASQTSPLTSCIFSNCRLTTDANGNLVVVLAGGGSSDTGIINVKDFDVTGDARLVRDAVTTNLSTTVTSATAGFDSARDVGKLVWGADTTGGPSGSSLSVPIGTIVSVTNSTTIVVSLAAVATNTGVTLVWGTDDTDNLQAAFAAAFAQAGPKPTIYLPAGMYIIDELLGDWRTGNAPAIVGEGAQVSTFIYKPDFDMGTTIAGEGMLVATSSTARPRYEGFGVTGGSFNFPVGLKYAIVLRGMGSIIRDVEVYNVQSTQDVNGGVQVNTCGALDSGQKCIIEDLFVHAVTGFGLFTNSSTLALTNFNYNENEGIHFDNNSHVVVFGSAFNDHFVPNGESLVVSGGTQAFFFGTYIRHRLSISGANSLVVCSGCTINDILASANRDAVSVGANTTFKYSASKLTSWGTGVWLLNSGLSYDLGGNTYRAATGSGGFTTAAPYNSSIATTTLLLPTCNAAAESYRNPVTDSDTATWGDTFAGSSTNRILAYCNGTDWTVMGK